MARLQSTIIAACIPWTNIWSDLTLEVGYCGQTVLSFRLYCPTTGFRLAVLLKVTVNRFRTDQGSWQT